MNEVLGLILFIGGILLFLAGMIALIPVPPTMQNIRVILFVTFLGLLALDAFMKGWKEFVEKAYRFAGGFMILMLIFIFVFAYSGIEIPAGFFVVLLVAAGMMVCGAYILKNY